MWRFVAPNKFIYTVNASLVFACVLFFFSRSSSGAFKMYENLLYCVATTLATQTVTHLPAFLHNSFYYSLFHFFPRCYCSAFISLPSLLYGCCLGACLLIFCFLYIDIYKHSAFFFFRCFNLLLDKKGKGKRVDVHVLLLLFFFFFVASKASWAGPLMQVCLCSTCEVVYPVYLC